MDSIVQMNNYGADLIGESRFTEAIQVLKTALHAVQAEMTDDTHRAPSLNTPITPNQTSNCPNTNESQLRFGEQDLRDGVYVYCHAIRADSFSTQHHGDKDQAFCTLSVKIVFNMALAHHLAALSADNEKSAFKFQGALKLYELGFQMQLQSGLLLEMKYVMAILNNCAHVYKAMNKLAKAKQFYKHMLSSLL